MQWFHSKYLFISFYVNTNTPLQDLPTTLPDGMVIGAVCEREDPRDAVIMHPRHAEASLAMLPKGSVIGGSPVSLTIWSVSVHNLPSTDDKKKELLFFFNIVYYSAFNFMYRFHIGSLTCPGNRFLRIM